MRTLFLVLCVVLVAAAPCFAEYDVAGVQSAKPKASAATVFDNGMAATRALEKLRVFLLNGMTRLILPLFAAACMLTVASRGRGEFDSGPARPKAAAMTSFDGGVEATQPVRKQRVFDHPDSPIPLALTAVALPSVQPPPPVTRADNIPRPKHGGRSIFGR
jgi:hypothetical protein